MMETIYEVLSRQHILLATKIQKMNSNLNITTDGSQRRILSLIDNKVREVFLTKNNS